LRAAASSITAPASLSTAAPASLSTAMSSDTTHNAATAYAVAMANEYEAAHAAAGSAGSASAAAGLAHLAGSAGSAAGSVAGLAHAAAGSAHAVAGLAHAAADSDESEATLMRRLSLFIHKVFIALGVESEEFKRIFQVEGIVIYGSVITNLIMIFMSDPYIGIEEATGLLVAMLQIHGSDIDMMIPYEQMRNVRSFTNIKRANSAYGWISYGKYLDDMMAPFKANAMKLLSSTASAYNIFAELIPSLRHLRNEVPFKAGMLTTNIEFFESCYITVQINHAMKNGSSLFRNMDPVEILTTVAAPLCTVEAILWSKATGLVMRYGVSFSTLLRHLSQKQFYWINPGIISEIVGDRDTNINSIMFNRLQKYKKKGYTIDIPRELHEFMAKRITMLSWGYGDWEPPSSIARLVCYYNHRVVDKVDDANEKYALEWSAFLYDYLMSVISDYTGMPSDITGIVAEYAMRMDERVYVSDAQLRQRLDENERERRRLIEQVSSRN